MTQEERDALVAQGGLYFSAEDLKAIKLTQAQAVKRLLYKWSGQRKRLIPIIEKQNGRCAITNEPLVSDGRLTHLDHKWTMIEAARAVVGGMPIGDAFNRLWAESNLRAVLARENYKRNKRVKSAPSKG
jgi:hypothetical protein